MIRLLSLLALLIAFDAVAQTSPREEQWRGRPLPPSLQSEVRQLRAKQGSRTIIYRDTVRGSQRARQLFLDSTAEFDTSLVFEDSALTTIDSGVSLTHKEWLDSMLVDIPELTRTASGMRFSYSQTIMTEPLRREVEITPIATSTINPIPKENLPYFDQSPIPLPITPGKRTEVTLLAGAGIESLPKIEGSLSHTFNQRFHVDVQGEYNRHSNTHAIPQHYRLQARTGMEFGPERAEAGYENATLEAEVDASGKLIQPPPDVSGTPAPDHLLALLGFMLNYHGRASARFDYGIQGSVSSVSDDHLRLSRESSQHIRAHGNYDIGPDFRLRGEVDLQFAGSENVLMDNVQRETSDLALRNLRVLFGQRSWGHIEWFGGARFVTSIDAGGTKSRLLPQGYVRIPLNPRWEIGGSFAPDAFLSSHRTLAQQNPFYNPSLSATLSNVLDPRRASIDRLNVTGFMTYMLSLDDQIHAEVRYIDRSDETIFDQDVTEAIAFTATPVDTRRLIVSGHTNLLVFKRDVLTAGLEFRSATIAGRDVAIPFEPTMRVHAGYRFNSIAPYLRPYLEARYVGRKDRSITSFDLGTDILTSENFTILVRAQNVLNSPGDYWTGYNELPRTLWAAVRYRI